MAAGRHADADHLSLPALHVAGCLPVGPSERARPLCRPGGGPDPAEPVHNRRAASGRAFSQCGPCGGLGCDGLGRGAGRLSGRGDMARGSAAAAAPAGPVPGHPPVLSPSGACGLDLGRAAGGDLRGYRHRDLPACRIALASLLCRPALSVAHRPDRRGAGDGHPAGHRAARGAGGRGWHARRSRPGALDLCGGGRARGGDDGDAGRLGDAHPVRAGCLRSRGGRGGGGHSCGLCARPCAGPCHSLACRRFPRSRRHPYTAAPSGGGYPCQYRGQADPCPGMGRGRAGAWHLGRDRALCGLAVARGAGAGFCQRLPPCRGGRHGRDRSGGGSARALGAPVASGGP